MPGGKRTRRHRGDRGAAVDTPAATYEPALMDAEQQYQDYDWTSHGSGYYGGHERSSKDYELDYDGGVDEYQRVLPDENGQPLPPQRQQQSPDTYGVVDGQYWSDEQAPLDEPTPDPATAYDTEEYHDHEGYLNGQVEQYHNEEPHDECADEQEPFPPYTNHVGYARRPYDEASAEGTYIASAAEDSRYIDYRYDDVYRYAPDGEEKLPPGGEQYGGEGEWQDDDFSLPGEQDCRQEWLEPESSEYLDGVEYTTALAADRRNERLMGMRRPRLSRVIQLRSNVDDSYQDDVYPDDHGQDAFTLYDDPNADQPALHNFHLQYYDDQTADDCPDESPRPTEPPAQRAVNPASSPPPEAPESDCSEDLQKYWDLANEPIDSDPVEAPPAGTDQFPPQAGGPYAQKHVERPIPLTKPPPPGSTSKDLDQTRPEERYATEVPKTQPVKSTKAPARVANKALGMTALRELVMIPEAKADPMAQDREIGTGENCQAVFDFFLDPTVKHSSQQPQKKKTTDQAVPAKTPALPNIGPSKGVKATSKQSATTASSSNNRQDPLRNPEWYTLASSTSPSDDDPQPIPILVGDRVNQLRPLYRALCNHDLEPVESEIQAQGADIALSPATAIILRTLDQIVQGHAHLLNDVKRAAFFFQRVVIIFEVVSYRDIDKDPERLIEESPPSQAVVTALGTLRRALAVSLIPDQEQVMGTAEVVFARHGAEEVAAVLRHLAEQDELKISSQCTPEARSVWAGQQWLSKEVDAHEEAIFGGAGFNLYSIHFLLAGFGSFEVFADQVSPAERSKLAGPVVGQDIIERFNKAYGRKKRKKELLTST